MRFYTEGIGFRELPGFEVPADVAAGAGLTDGKPLAVRVLVLGEGDSATKLKLMQVAGTTPRTGDNEFIHSHTGFRYLTIIVADTDAALARLAKLGVKPMAKSPVALPETLAPGMFLTCVRDPDGNIVELVGPRPAVPAAITAAGILPCRSSQAITSAASSSGARAAESTTSSGESGSSYGSSMPGESLDLAGAGLLVEPLRVAALADLERGLHVHLHEVAGGERRPVRRRGRGGRG